jgi:hypothetical protein
LIIPALYDTMQEAWQAREDPDTHSNGYPEPIGEIEPVEIYSNYGHGMWWAGTAARNTVVQGIDPYDSLERGKRIELHREKPDWVRDRHGTL